MKRLSQFLYKVFLTTLAGIFISIGTFPAEVIALNLSKIPPQFREQARQQEAPLRPDEQNGNSRDNNGCPPFAPGHKQPELPQLEVWYLSQGKTLTANTGSFTPWEVLKPFYVYPKI